MSNDFARVTRSIWSDDDFRDLPMASQWLYFHLLTSPALNYAGVTDWRPARIAALSRGLTADAVEAASVDLVGNLYTVVDRDTEEVLIRSFIRHDGLMAQPNMACAMVKAHSGLASRPLRGVIVHELIRLHEDQPGLAGWDRADVQELLERDPLTPDEAFNMLPTYEFHPSFHPSVKGSVKGSFDPSAKGSDKGCPTPYSLLPTPSPNSDQASRGSETLISGSDGKAKIVTSRHLKAANE